MKLCIGFNDPVFIDVLEAELAETGFESFDRTSRELIAYIPLESVLEDSIKQVLDSYANEITKTERETIVHQNWNATWEADYQPVFIDHLMIKAPFHEVDPNIKEVITINPNMSFGTGHHPTTEQVLREMMTLELAEKSFLDFGCGSGILCIYAAQHGANGIGVEIDPHAAEAARENLGINNVSTFSIKTGGIEQIENHTFDLIAANINRNVIEESLPTFYSALNIGGSILCSGFLEDDIIPLISSIERTGLKVYLSSSKGGWGIICAKRTA
ncbi:MAG: 50S ribosomal protein L11 methyltransferase [Flavobacteriales bacterium]